jgi:hypothetical protein
MKAELARNEIMVEKDDKTNMMCVFLEEWAKVGGAALMDVLDVVDINKKSHGTQLEQYEDLICHTAEEKKKMQEQLTRYLRAEELGIEALRCRYGRWMDQRIEGLVERGIELDVAIHEVRENSDGMWEDWVTSGFQEQYVGGVSRVRSLTVLAYKVVASECVRLRIGVSEMPKQTRNIDGEGSS